VQTFVSARNSPGSRISMTSVDTFCGSV